MTNHVPESDLPVVRHVDLRSLSKPSRLLERGIAALAEERMVPLDILRLIAYESSVFVLSTDWDAQASEYLIFPGDTVERDASFRALDLDYDHEQSDIEALRHTRQFTMYEFHRTGYFIQKLTMELVRLTEEGYEQLEGRSPGRPMISSNFIHFHEVLVLAWNLPDVRIDYLFSRKGERLAVWSDHPFPNLFRAPDEPLVPIFHTFHPRWAASDCLIASSRKKVEFDVLDGSVELKVVNSELAGMRRDDQYFAEDWGDPSTYIFEHQHYQMLTSRFNNIQLFNDYPSRKLCAQVVGNPVERFRLTLDTFQGGWDMTTSDPLGIWFMDTESAEIWRIGFVAGEIMSSPCHEMSHPLDWIRDGIIGIIDHQHDQWSPSSEDYQRLYDYQYRNQRPYEDLECQLWGAWGDDVILEVLATWREGYSWDSTEPILLLFRGDNDKMRHVKILNPFKDVQRPLTHDDSREPDHQNALPVPFRHPLVMSRYMTFSDGYLYSFCDGGEKANSILVTDIVADECVRFRPEVPAD